MCKYAVLRNSLLLINCCTNWDLVALVTEFNFKMMSTARGGTVKPN